MRPSKIFQLNYRLIIYVTSFAGGWPMLQTMKKLSFQVLLSMLSQYDDDDDTDNALSSARRPWSTSSDFYFHVFLSFADSCSLLVPRLSRPSDWSNVFAYCIHMVFCRPLGILAGFNAIWNDCLAGVPSCSLKMCPVNQSLFWFILSFYKYCLLIVYILVFVIVFG